MYPDSVDPDNTTSHEESFVQAFVVKERRERILFELQKHRGRFLGRFCHHALDLLDPRFVTVIQPPNSDPIEISRMLISRGASKRCYAMSHNDDIDGRFLPLADALAGAVGFGIPSILSCRPGLLAYVETEQIAGPPERLIVTQPITATSASGRRQGRERPLR